MVPTAITNLDTLFVKLQNSPRFQLISSLSAATFATVHPWNKTLAEVTLQELTSLPATELAEMTNATEAQLNNLYELLSPLINGTEAFGTETPPALSPFELLGESSVATMTTEIKSKPSSLRSKRTFGIAEAEFKLKEAAKNLRLSDPSPKLLLQPLESFWPKNAPASPFESSITLRGFLDLNHEALLKKRSMSAEKIDAILSALESATQSSYAEKRGGVPASFSPELQRSPFVQGSLEQQTFQLNATTPPAATYALLLLTAPVLPALHGFITSCENTPTALTLWNAECVESALSSFSKKIRNEISSWALRTFGPFHQSKDFAAYPTHKILVVSPFSAGQTEQQAIIISRLVEIALHASGFTHPVIGTTPLTSLWTTEPQALPKLVRACQSLKNKPEGCRLLRQALPFLTEEEALSIISQQKRTTVRKKKKSSSRRR